MRGNPGKRALNKREPKPRRGVPPCPRFMSDRGAGAWKRIGGLLDSMGVLTHADQGALVLLCEAFADWFECVDVVRREGIVYETPTAAGSIVKRAHPAVAMRNDAHRRIQSLLIEFGLTPAARSKVQRIDDDDADPLEELLREAQRPA